MPIQQNKHASIGSDDSFPTSDETSLIRSVATGDERALRTLVAQNDRLVRFTIFRMARDQCMRDPQWLDAVASETWNGFVSSARRGVDLRSNSVARYLVGIARQQTITALRRLRAFARIPQNTLSEAGFAQIESAELDPASLTAEMEQLAALRDCAATLDDADRRILTQLRAISERKWVEAARVLELSESTLRSRWDRILNQLRACMEKKSP